MHKLPTIKMPVAKLIDARLAEELSTRERRAFQRAETTIAKGMKAFVAVGLALREIRDRRLYREHYGTFAEYCARRWEISRPRGYELCAAAEVVENLSAIADIRLLPENEAQTRPLTRLKEPSQWREAWHSAVKVATAEKRSVTARDTEDAVRNIDSKSLIIVPDGASSEPIYNCIQGDNGDLIRTVARLYLKKGDRVADLTYGRGAFWRQVDLADFDFYKSDKITCPSSPHDFRRLPYKDCLFDAVVLDPPFAHHGDSLLVEPAYNNASTTAGLYHEEIIQLYRQGMTESKRVLKAGGLMLVKCSDEIESSKQKRSHIEVHGISMELRLEDQDFFVLMRQHPPVVQFKMQKHARKNCSFLWVFKKPSR